MALEREQVQDALDEIREYLQADGGDCELVDVAGVDVLIRLVGACNGCPSSSMTLTAGIENHLRDKFSELGQLITV